MEDDSILYIGGSNTVIYAFSLQSHEIIDIWTVGENISAMDCLS
jgi:microtubule-associated protein-like 5